MHGHVPVTRIPRVPRRLAPAVRLAPVVMAAFACAALLTWAVRSYFVSDLITVAYPHHYWSVVTGRGKLQAMYGYDAEVRPGRRAPYGNWSTTPPALLMMPVTVASRLGFGGASQRSKSTTFCAACAPFWFVALPFAVWPALVMRRIVRDQRRVRRGLCMRCGYDSRGVSGRCPECGTAVAASDAPPANGNGAGELAAHPPTNSAQ